MAAKKLFIAESLLSDNLLHLHEGIASLLLWGLLVLLLFTALNLGSVLAAEQFESQDFALVEDSLFDWTTVLIPTRSSYLLSRSGDVVLPLFYQYLRSHIGEKRLSDSNSIPELTNSMSGYRETALFYRAVFLFRFCPFAVAFSLARHVVNTRR